jgi:hypothetical protein
MTLQVPECTEVALERGYQVVPIPGMSMKKSILHLTPLKTTFIHRNVPWEFVQHMIVIASPTPNLEAGRPALTRMRKVGAKEAVHPRSDLATLGATAAPKPKAAGIPYVAKGEQKKRVKSNQQAKVHALLWARSVKHQSRLQKQDQTN